MWTRQPGWAELPLQEHRPFYHPHSFICFCLSSHELLMLLQPVVSICLHHFAEYFSVYLFETTPTFIYIYLNLQHFCKQSIEIIIIMIIMIIRIIPQSPKTTPLICFPVALQQTLSQHKCS